MTDDPVADDTLDGHEVRYVRADLSGGSGNELFDDVVLRQDLVFGVRHDGEQRAGIVRQVRVRAGRAPLRFQHQRERGLGENPVDVRQVVRPPPASTTPAPAHHPLAGRRAAAACTIVRSTTAGESKTRDNSWANSEAVGSCLSANAMMPSGPCGLIASAASRMVRLAMSTTGPKRRSMRWGGGASATGSVESTTQMGSHTSPINRWISIPDMRCDHARRRFVGARSSPRLGTLTAVSLPALESDLQDSRAGRHAY